MELLIVILNKTEYLNDILSLFVEVEIKDVTIFDSEGIGHYLAYKVPVFAGLRELIGDSKEHNKTIFAIVEKDGALAEFRKLMKKEGIDFSKPGMGVMFSVPLKTIIK